ncbi:hypothetical protein AB0G60_13600 [Streptomyces angustmyceticus]|uniref:Lipoprotein n=1 Tax=Streptomyces angustmyceticus TaxID=285578 RepID=A0A5J4LI73_9ACTN|nr:hypothetical protein [Streptomyces angustmyceticus]UAL67534.1 hypothetical protein K7396_14120 [Streptomyces angustmyceticus]GES31290.1 hypothetical protein San01_37770 [Streptomyces angustmyceticus]
MTSRRRAAGITAALTCGVAVIAGFAGPAAAAAPASDGGEGDLADKSAQQISDESLRQLLTAQSLRLRTETSADPTKLDLTLDRAGNCTGSVSKGEFGRVDLVKRGEQVWMKPDAAFWKTQFPGRKGDDAAQRYKDTYLHGTTKNAFLRGVTAACDLKAFQKSATGSGKPSSGTPSPSRSAPLTKGRPTTEDGARVLPVVKKAHGAVQTLYVAIDGKHYPRKLTAEVDHETGTILLSDYDTPVSTKTPAPGETADISALEDLMKGSQGA